MQLYVLKPVGEDVWVVDGIVRTAYFGGSIPFPTRMVVARLGSGDVSANLGGSGPSSDK